MSKKLLSTLIASLFVAAPALAQSDEPFRVSGQVSAGPIYVNVDGQDPTRLQEYQDLGKGVLSNVFVQGRGGRNWIDFYGENFGRDDQTIFARGGQYDVFKYGAFSNSMPHNFAFGALTPYTGTGSGLLVTTWPQTNPANWGSFTLGYKRTDNGGYFEWQGLAPWYFRVDGNQVKFDGTKVGAAANGTSPGNGYTDLAFPTQYQTSNWGVEGGYQTSKLTVSARWDYSKFDNAIERLNWSNPFFGNSSLDTSYLPPDNEFNKFTLTGSYRDLPWKSVISARYTWSEAKSHTDLGLTALNGAGAAAYPSTLADENVFHGKHTTQTFQASWTAMPMQGLDTRLYYFYTKLENKSDLVEYGNAPTQPLATGLGCGSVPPATGNPATTAWVPGNCENELFAYKKNNVGFDAYWRFAKGHRLGAGWDYFKLEQDRIDYDEMKQNKYFVEYKNTMLDNVTARLKYTYIDRDSNYLDKDAGINANDPNYLLRFTSAYDMQKMRGSWWKATVDWMPMPMLALAFEGQWKDNDYKDITYGRTSDKREEYYITATWGAPDTIRVTGFFDWEQIKYPSQHRYIGTVSGGPPSTTTPPGFCLNNPNCYNPTTAPNSGSYNWNSGTKDQNWVVGVGLDVPVNDRLMIKASYMYFETNGSADFSSQNAAGDMVGAGQGGFGSPIPVNITQFDDSKRQSFNIKGIWQYNKNWSFTLGYAYEKWSYDDVGYAGYQYTLPYPAVTNNTAQSYLNGYNGFTNSNQNIVYGLATFKF